MNKNCNFQIHRNCSPNILHNVVNVSSMTKNTGYTDKICWLFQSVQNCIGFQEIGHIRPFLYRAKCMLDWYERKMQRKQDNPEMQCSCLLIQALRSLLYQNDPSKKLKMNCQAHVNINFETDSMQAFTYLELLQNPFQILNRYGSQFDDIILETAAELIVLALTNVQFRDLSPKMLAFGALNAINKYKGKKQEIKLTYSAEISNSQQAQKSVQLFTSLLKCVENM